MGLKCHFGGEIAQYKDNAQATGLAPGLEQKKLPSTSPAIILSSQNNLILLTVLLTVFVII